MPGGDRDRDEIVSPCPPVGRCAEDAARPQRQHQQDGEEADRAAVGRRQEQQAELLRRPRPPARPRRRREGCPARRPRRRRRSTGWCWKPISGSMVVSRPISMPPRPASPMATNDTRRATMSALMPLMAASIGLSATARMALPVRVKDEEGEQQRHGDHRDDEVLYLLRPDAQAAPHPVAPDRQVVAAQLVAEDEAHDSSRARWSARSSRWRW